MDTHAHTHTLTYKRVRDHDKEPTVASIHRTSAEDDEDLGIIFILFHPSKVHVALALPSVASIRPILQQGKKNY